MLLQPEEVLEMPEAVEAVMAEGCEIYDGEYPAEPRGCFAQAWSDAEIVRAWKEAVSMPHLAK